MHEFDKLIELTSDERVELGTSFKELLHKELCLGMTRYVCRYGTLSDGHEKLTDAQRYYQAIREMYNRAHEVQSQKAAAMEAQADLLDAEEDLARAINTPAKLRAEAAIMRAHGRLVTSLVTVEDILRQLDEFNKVRLELKKSVQAQYPEGIEQAEEDNWKAVMKYRHLKRSLGYGPELTHVPLAPEVKAQLGFELGRPELTAWLAIQDEKKALQLIQQEEQKHVALR
jgi:hypothetical protein